MRFPHRNFYKTSHLKSSHQASPASLPPPASKSRKAKSQKTQVNVLLIPRAVKPHADSSFIPDRAYRLLLLLFPRPFLTPEEPTVPDLAALMRVWHGSIMECSSRYTFLFALLPSQWLAGLGTPLFGLDVRNNSIGGLG